MGTLESVNIAAAAHNPWKVGVTTGIDKRPHIGPIAVRTPGPGGSGLAGDHVGDTEHHGGGEQAVYAFQREDLDDWELRLGRSLPNGFFGENFTTVGMDVNAARIGERWRVGPSLELAVTGPRIPCSTFRGWTAEPGWLKTFTAAARPGAYLRVLTPGTVTAGDLIEVTHQPDHHVTVALVFRAALIDRGLLTRVWAAEEDLSQESAGWLRGLGGPA